MLQGNKKLSGSQNLKRKKQQEAENEKGAKQLAKFVKVIDHRQILVADNNNTDKSTTPTNEDASTSTSQVEMTPDSTLLLKVSEDIAKWPHPLPNSVIDEIMLREPNNGKLDNDEDYPRDANGRHFSNKHFQRIMPNRETYNRRWLVYSRCSSKVFCLYCHIFRRYSLSNLANEGYDDWAHISLALQKHEISKDHQSATCSWLEATKRLGRLTGVDQHLL